MDVDFEFETIEKFYKYAEQITDFIILSPPNYNRDYPKSFYYQKNTINNQIIRMKIVHGHFLFFKMSSLLKVGRYDEKIFMYYDETDYCLRATKMNEKIYIIKNPQVMHKEGKSYEIRLMQKTQNIRHWHIMCGNIIFLINIMVCCEHVLKSCQIC